VEGYHSDKTVTLVFQGAMTDAEERTHKRCLDIVTAGRRPVAPGVMLPSVIYEQIMKSLPPEFLAHFIGAGSDQVRFLGHGVGWKLMNTR
jgi:Xaa-Pro aminopeptidase